MSLCERCRTEPPSGETYGFWERQHDDGAEFFPEFCLPCFAEIVAGEFRGKPARYGQFVALLGILARDGTLPDALWDTLIPDPIAR